jgi:AcrR family transcriptional regulator
MDTSAPTTAKMGRPRGFQEDVAIEAAMRVFWKNGYEGTSINDLIEVMGINRSSMYTTIGGKEAVFRRAVQRYQSLRMTYIAEALAQPSLREVLAGLFRGTADFLGENANPRGCLVIQGALVCGTDSMPVKQEMIDLRKNGEVAIRKRLQQAQTAGELPSNVQPSDFARYISSVMAGLSVQATNGASKTELRRISEIALRCLEASL